LKQNHRQLFEAVLLARAEGDPLGLIADGAPRDEYELEAGTVLPRLNPEDVERILHEEFVDWFGANSAGPLETYRPASVAVWRAWEHFRRLTD